MNTKDARNQLDQLVGKTVVISACARGAVLDAFRCNFEGVLSFGGAEYEVVGPDGFCRLTFRARYARFVPGKDANYIFVRI